MWADDGPRKERGERGWAGAIAGSCGSRPRSGSGPEAKREKERQKRRVSFGYLN